MRMLQKSVEGFCCPVPSEPRLGVLPRRASFEVMTTLKQRRHVPQHSCHLQLLV